MTDIIQPKVDAGIDPKSLTHRARIVEEVLAKLLIQIKQLVELRYSKTDDRHSKESQLRVTIDEQLDQLIELFQQIKQDKESREAQLQNIREEFGRLVRKFERINNYCIAKLPAVVQKEHENVAATLVKLRWSISQSEEEHEALTIRVHTLNAYNQKLEQDIQRLSGCTSLANEKFAMEKAEMERISKETSEATKMLTEATDKMNETEIRNRFAIDRAAKTRAELNKEFKQTESNLKQAEQNLNEALETEPRLILETKSVLQQAKTAKSRAIELHKELKHCTQNVTDGIKSVSDMMQELDIGQKSLDSLEYWLRVNQRRLETRFDGTMDQELDELRQRHHLICGQFEKSRLEEMDLQVQVDVYNDRITKSTKTIDKVKQEIERLKKRMSEGLVSLGDATNRYNRIKSEHEKVTNKLEHTNAETRTSQERMRKQIAQVDDRIKEEMTNRASLLAAIERDIKELERAQMQSLLERKGFEERIADLEQMVSTMDEKVKAIGAERERCVATSNLLTDEFKTLNAQWNEEQGSLCQTLSGLEQTIAERRQTITQLNQQFLEMQSDKERLIGEKDRLKKSISAIFKIKLRKEDEVCQLRCLLAELEATGRAHQTHLNAITDQMRESEKRQQERIAEFYTLFQSRRATLDEFMRQLADAINENNQLASTYENNQKEQMQLVHAFHLTLSELSIGQWEMCDAEQFEALCTRVLRETGVHERRHRAGPQLLLLQLGQHWDAVSCRIQAIQEHSQRKLKITDCPGQ